MSVKVMFKTLLVMLSLHVRIQINFYKCKIASITIKLILFQAISWPLDWSGQDLQNVFPPVAPVEVGFKFTNIYLFGRILKMLLVEIEGLIL